MAQYRCLNCGYSGDELVYQFNDYSYCIASNEEEPDFIDDYPDFPVANDYNEMKDQLLKMF